MVDEQKKIDDLDTGLGDKDSVSLKPAVVQILEPKVVVVPKKEGSKMKKESKMTELMVKHPDREDSFVIKNAKVIKGDKIQVLGLWFELDSEGKVVKNSALGILMKQLGANTPRDLVGKKVNTELDSNGYLVLKAY